MCHRPEESESIEHSTDGTCYNNLKLWEENIHYFLKNTTMAAPEKKIITVVAVIHAPVEKVWLYLTDPKYIIHWNNASEEWHTPRAVNDLRAGGRFLSRMESKDGKMGFDFSGQYDKVEEYRLIEYTLDDGRKVKTSFVSHRTGTVVTEEFEAEGENSVEMQKEGWQAILDNFKKFVEGEKE